MTNGGSHKPVKTESVKTSKPKTGTASNQKSGQ